MQNKFKRDHVYGVDNENTLIEILKQKGYDVIKNGETSIHDIIFEKEGKKYSAEIKSRRANIGDYEDTLIGANKLGEAWNLYYKEGIETLFFFIYYDGIYYINPFEHVPRRDYLLQRWDRNGFDKKKGWIYFKTSDLILL